MVGGGEDFGGIAVKAIIINIFCENKFSIKM